LTAFLKKLSKLTSRNIISLDESEFKFPKELRLEVKIFKESLTFENPRYDFKSNWIGRKEELHDS
jgi:hypothetical protein